MSITRRVVPLKSSVSFFNIRRWWNHICLIIWLLLLCWFYTLACKLSYYLHSSYGRHPGISENHRSVLRPVAITASSIMKCYCTLVYRGQAGPVCKWIITAGHWLSRQTVQSMPVACSTETEVAVELQSLMFVTALDTVTVKCWLFVIARSDESVAPFSPNSPRLAQAFAVCCLLSILAYNLNSIYCRFCLSLYI